MSLIEVAIQQYVKRAIEPQIEELKEQIEVLKEENRFILYPKGLQDYFGVGQDQAGYQRIYRIWNQKNFPRRDRDGIKGAYHHDIKNYLSQK